LSYERYIRCGSPPLTSTSISPSNTERRWWTSAPDVLLFYGMEKIICIEGLELREKKKKAKVKADINNYCWSLVNFIGETNILPFLQEEYHHLSRYVPFFFCS